MFSTNLSEHLLDDGNYPAEIVRTKEIRTKNGDPMVFVDWHIFQGEERGRIVSQGIAFVPSMIGRNNHLLKAMGQPHGQAVDIDPDEWIGVKCLIVVGQKDGKQEVLDLQPLPADFQPTAPTDNVEDEVTF